MDPDQVRQNVQLSLYPNCLQRSPAGESSRQRIKPIYDGILFNVTSYVEARDQAA